MAHNPKVGSSNPPPATNRTLHKTLIFLPGLPKPNEKLNKARPKPSGIPLFRGSKSSVLGANFFPILVSAKKKQASRLNVAAGTRKRIPAHALSPFHLVPESNHSHRAARAHRRQP